MNGSVDSAFTIARRPVGAPAPGCSDSGHYPPVAPGGSERLLGRALAGRRDRVLVATTFGHPLFAGTGAGAAAGTLCKSVEGSLRRLGTCWIDLRQLHKPDPDVPVRRRCPPSPRWPAVCSAESTARMCRLRPGAGCSAGRA
ncbi:aldo/keto reductase [Amycolatopsis thermophila]|uniref:aldo/keto reductase n=1 Tax=Amycolatopsis thermophila TaxID=206084 RepID=UPI0035205EAC